MEFILKKFVDSLVITTTENRNKVKALRTTFEVLFLKSRHLLRHDVYSPKEIERTEAGTENETHFEK